MTLTSIYQHSTVLLVRLKYVSIVSVSVCRRDQGQGLWCGRRLASVDVVLIPPPPAPDGGREGPLLRGRSRKGCLTGRVLHAGTANGEGAVLRVGEEEDDTDY